MPTLIPYHLAFRKGFHLGTRGVNPGESLAYLPSDTLFSALVHAARRSGDLAALLDPFTSASHPPFRLTSAFPFAGEVRFYPMPANLRGLFPDEALMKEGKTLKRVHYLSEGLLRAVQSGSWRSESVLLSLTAPERRSDWFPPKKKENGREGERKAPLPVIPVQGGSLLLTPAEAGRLPDAFRAAPDRLHTRAEQVVWKSASIQRVTLDRLSSASNVYQVGKVSFAEGCGLWFGVAWNSSPDMLRQAFERALALLQDDGLGGERTSGYGQFTCQRQPPLTLPDPADGQPGLLLSRYHPCPGELPEALTAPGVAYNLVAVSGWINSPDGAALRRKRVQLVAEGSLVRLPEGLGGDIADVTPELGGPRLSEQQDLLDEDNPEASAATNLPPEIAPLPHRVYRYGLAIATAWPFSGEARNA